MSAVYWFSLWMIFPLLKGYWFWHVGLIKLSFTKLTCLSNYFPVNVLGKSWYLIIPFAVKDSSTSSFLILRPITAFFCLIDLAYMSNTMINVVWWYEASCLFCFLFLTLLEKFLVVPHLVKFSFLEKKYILCTYYMCIYILYYANYMWMYVIYSIHMCYIVIILKFH